MNLILLHPGEIDDHGIVRLTDDRAEHVRSVLKAEAGDSIRIGVLDGPKGTAAVSAIHEGSVELRCSLSAEVPERPRIDLLLALPRPKVMKRLWAQLAALGIGRIILTNAWKVEKNYFDTHVLDPDFYRPRLIEGLQQAGDTCVPEVSIHRRFKVLVEDDLDALFPKGARRVAHPGGAPSGFAFPSDGRVLLAVGPEGGWTEYELGLLEARGFERIGLGARTLRTDTACVALLSIAHYGCTSPASGLRS